MHDVGHLLALFVSVESLALHREHTGTPLCRLCGRLDDLISEPTRAAGATVTAGTVTLIGLPRMARKRPHSLQTGVHKDANKK